ncbi:MAG: T9SS type A sorting domain-containing protein [Bacteroidia bacterium]|nr:T9SS type A sorting domain-containing protein [Bacteroidia bacterium]
MKKFYAIVLSCLLLASMASAQATVTIRQIQYATNGISPYLGDTVTTSGIVTAHDVTSFWIQDSSKAWNGLYVYSTSAGGQVSVGDRITITGQIDEFNGLTEMKNVTNVNVVSSGNALPAPLLLTTTVSGSEPYESVLVRVKATCTNPSSGFGQWVLNDGSGPVFVDDLIIAYTPTLNCKYTVTGPMYYSFSEWKIQIRDTTADVVKDSCGGGSGNPGDTTTIYKIQYTTATSGDSPLKDQNVTVWGTVTCLDGGGYWIQDSSKAWNGIYVFDGNNTPSPGDNVWVKGKAVEFFNYTEINATSLNTVSSGNPLPAPVSVSTAAANQEMFEGVRIQVTNATCTNDQVASNFGQWELNDGTGAILIDDLMFAYTPTAGLKYTVTGPLLYSFSEWKIEPCGAADVEVFVGIDDDQRVAGLNIFPNPAQNQLQVSFDGSNGVAQVTLFNLVGQQMMQTHAANQTTLDVSALPRGMYMLQVTAGEKSSTQRIVLR